MHGNLARARKGMPRGAPQSGLPLTAAPGHLLDFGLLALAYTLAERPLLAGRQTRAWHSRVLLGHAIPKSATSKLCSAGRTAIG